MINLDTVGPQSCNLSLKAVCIVQDSLLQRRTHHKVFFKAHFKNYNLGSTYFSKDKFEN